MRILYYSDSISPANNAAAVRSEVIVKTLREQNLEIDLRSSNDLIFKTASNKSSFPVRTLCEILSGLELAIRLLFSSADLIYLSSPPFLTTAIPATVLKLFGKQFIFEVRDPYPEVYFQHKLLTPESIIGRIFKSFVANVYRGSLITVVATEGIKDVVMSYGVDASKIIAVKNGFDETQFSPTQDKWPQFTCVFHGNLGHMQNIDLLISVAEATQARQAGTPEHDKVKFVVYGDGPQRQKLENSKVLDYRGSATYKELCQVIKKAHIGLSFRDDGPMGEIALPVKVFEYIGSGLPTLLTPASEAGRMVDDNKIGFQFKNDDRDAIVEKLLELKKDRAQYDQLTANIQSARLNFSRQKQALLLSDKIKSLS